MRQPNVPRPCDEQLQCLLLSSFQRVRTLKVLICRNVLTMPSKAPCCQHKRHTPSNAASENRICAQLTRPRRAHRVQSPDTPCDINRYLPRKTYLYPQHLLILTLQFVKLPLPPIAHYLPTHFQVAASFSQSPVSSQLLFPS